MDRYEIDLRAKQLDEETRVWRMFPGFNYMFFRDFLEQNCVFLDHPGLKLPDGLTSAPDARMKERLALSKATEQWIEEMKQSSDSAFKVSVPSRPSANLDDYASAPHVRNYGRVTNFISTLFDVVEKGDLIVIPNKVPTREVIIGEVLDGPDVRSYINPSRFPREIQTPYRRVRWFSPVHELRVPQEVSDVLRIPIAVSLLPQQFYSSIFELSYGTFLRPEEYYARIRVNGADFSAQDTIDLGAFAKLAAFISASVDDSVDLNDLKDYLDILVSHEFQPTLSLNINSPGFGAFRASKLSPVIFSALVAFFVTADARANPHNIRVTLTNSVPISDRCVTDADKPVMSEIEMKVNQTLAIVGIPEYKKFCERAQRLANGPMVKVDSKAKHVK